MASGERLTTYPALDLRYSPGPHSAALEDLLHAELDNFRPTAIAEHETADGWRVYFRDRGHRDAAVAHLRERFGSSLTGLSCIEVADEDWARRSQQQLTAVRVDRITVAPPWHTEPPSTADDVVVVIDPSIGFGTGHHETTRMCLQLLQRVDVRGRRVIDVGTGSGVLAIAAWKLGAQRVLAIDSDPDALLNARENIARNGATSAIEVREVDLEALRVPPAELVLANLTAAALERHAAVLSALVATPGTIIVSGFGPDEAAAVVGWLGLVPEASSAEGAWAALMLGKGASA